MACCVFMCGCVCVAGFLLNPCKQQTVDVKESKCKVKNPKK